MMSEAALGRRHGIRLAGALLATAALSACSEGDSLAFLQPKSEGVEVARNETATTKLVERDVEAPDVFSATEAGLWDGRPSLGGVWVAHPDVSEPERVIIRNTSNDKFVIGALFRRERDIPGPRLQASSDAAAALGMLAGAPVQLNVTALRREEVSPGPSAAPVAAAPVAEEPADADAEIADAAAIAIADTAAPIETAPEAEAEVLDTATATTANAEQPATKKSWFGAGLFGKRNKDVGEPLNALDPQPIAASAPSVETKPLASSSPPPQKSSLEKPYVQIGIFSVEENANNTADQMRNNGIVPTVFEQSSNGKEFWRVVVGPAQSSSERASLLKKIKGIGFSDAYAVTN